MTTMDHTVNVNVGHRLNDYPEVTTPTTPRGPLHQQVQHQPVQHHPTTTSITNEQQVESPPTTPTSHRFSGISGQRPLPTSPFRNTFSASNAGPASRDKTDRSRKRESAQSYHSNASQDIDMEEEDEMSDGEALDPNGKPSKKKKGQRFYCTDYPPCKLSFTRSEHLARHIRKHTGERPFQCHCSRRFSRLDNLRQHAQTVHVNEDIPLDSLAATGTRFQRQVRTERVARPGGNRSRASTVGSQGSHPRGHARNLSTPSISSTSSISRDDRRRPPPLIMPDVGAQGHTPPGSTFFRESSDGLSTPTSTTYSTGAHSPGYGSSVGSPVSNARSSGYWESRGHARRLSVPSGPSIPSGPNNPYGSPYLSPLASSQASTFSNIGSALASPSNAPISFSLAGREALEAEIRRRTWHPTPHTYSTPPRPGQTQTQTNFSRPVTSGGVGPGFHQSPEPMPSYNRQAQPQRLPGIETFDQAPTTRRPATPPPARGHSPMHIDRAPPPYPNYPQGVQDRRAHVSWDMSLHQNLHKLDIKESHPPGQAQAQGSGTSHPYAAAPVIHQDTQREGYASGQATGNVSRAAKRQGWYAGPPVNAPSDSVSSIREHTSVERERLMESNPHSGTYRAQHTAHHSTGSAWPLSNHPGGIVTPPPSQHPQYASQEHNRSVQATPSTAPSATQRKDRDSEMSGLDVLVAAATREENNANAAPAPQA